MHIYSFYLQRMHIKISVRTNPHPLINRIIRRRAKVGNKCIACGPFKQ